MASDLAAFGASRRRTPQLNRDAGREFPVTVTFTRVSDLIDLVQRLDALGLLEYVAASPDQFPRAALKIAAESEADAVEQVTVVLARMRDIEILRVAVSA